METQNNISPRQLRLSDFRFLLFILTVSLVLNLWGIEWGAPMFWHPDEITQRAIEMVGARSINPHHFSYGGLHYYVLGLGAVVPIYLHGLVFDPPPSRQDSLARERWWVPRIARIITLSRQISALMSTAIVFFTWAMGQILFDKPSGRLAASLLSLSMPFVAVAHFATVDAGANFWYWLSCFSALLIWKRGDCHWFILAAITAGFSIGTKLDHAMVLLPLATAVFLRRQSVPLRKISALVGLISFGYFIANPALFTSFFEFMDGTTRDLFYNALRQREEGSSHVQVLHHLKSGLGAPLFAAVIGGLAYGLYALARGKEASAILWLLTAIVPYYVCFGSRGIQDWYLPLFLPALMILAARACIDLITFFPGRPAYLAKAAICAVAIYSLLYSFALALQFSNDSRYLAAQWINQNVPSAAKIQLGERGPGLSQDRHRITYAKRDPDVMDYSSTNRDNLERNPTYRKVRQMILDLERWTGDTFGLQVRETPYRAWFDHRGWLQNPHARQSSAAPDAMSGADYVVLAEDLYPHSIRNLMLPDSGYRLVAWFHFVDPVGMRPVFPFVNPPVYIFRRSLA